MNNNTTATRCSWLRPTRNVIDWVSWWRLADHPFLCRPYGSSASCWKEVGLGCHLLLSYSLPQSYGVWYIYIWHNPIDNMADNIFDGVELTIIWRVMGFVPSTVAMDPERECWGLQEFLGRSCSMPTSLHCDNDEKMTCWMRVCLKIWSSHVSIEGTFIFGHAHGMGMIHTCHPTW